MTPKRIEVSGSAISTATQTDLFDLLADGSTWPLWSPISSFQLESELPDGEVGAVRSFRTGLFTSHEEIVRVEPPMAFGYTLVKSKALHVRDYRAEVTLAPHSDGTTITWTGSFKPLFPGSGWIWKRIINRIYRQFAVGLAAHADQFGHR